ncbi:MAG: aspartate--tRNA(Asn) ligase [Candidatus Paceibacteria bacterium]
MKDRTIASVFSEYQTLDGKEVKLAGWVHNYRELGSLTFITLRDGSGKIQVKITKGETENVKLEKESAIIVIGKVKKEPRAPGEVEIEAKSVEIVGKIYQQPPFYPSQKEEPGLSVRLDNRSLDLRREKTRAIFNIRSTLEFAFREALLSLNFQEITPACIVGSSTEGGAQLFKIDYFDRPAFLAQSPQFYKQLAVIGGLERVFMTTPVFRAEKHEGPFHINEIHQMDVEMAFADDNDALAIIEEVFLHMLRCVREKNHADLKILNKELKVPKQVASYKYSEIVDKLSANGEKIRWGDDFSREQEAKICEIAKNEAVLVRDYPTAVRAFYSMPYSDNPKICKAYDLIYRGIEVCSGAQRIHFPDLLEKQIIAKGMDPAGFSSYINAFKYGAPPHAGWSMGLDRITMAVCGLNNIREAVMFPRDKQRVMP